VPLLEERAKIDKRTVTTGKVRVFTHTETVEELVRAVLEGRKRTLLLSSWIRPSAGLHPGSERRMVSPLSRCSRKSSL